MIFSFIRKSSMTQSKHLNKHKQRFVPSTTISTVWLDNRHTADRSLVSRRWRCGITTSARRLAALGGRFHGYIKKQKVALIVSMTIRLGNPLAFDPNVTARVAACVLRIDGINITSTTGNNVGTASSFKEILAKDNLLLRVAIETSFLEVNRAKPTVFRRLKVCRLYFLSKLGCIGNLNELYVTIFLL